jgi:ParB family chromosome partitioning protein
MSEPTYQPPNIKKKTSLGRGLGSLLGGAPELSGGAGPQMSAESIQAAPNGVTLPVSPPLVQGTGVADESQVWTIPIDRLHANTQQPRQVFTPEALKELSFSIKEKGILQPIVARRLGEREFQIIAGERRWRAAQLAGLHEVPVILKKVSEQDSLEYAIIENIQRENLNALEEAEAYELLLGRYALTQQQVADKLGKDRSTIANSLRLLSLPAELKVMIRKNELSLGHAKVLLGVEGAAAQIAIAKQIVSEKLSVRATEKLAVQSKSGAKKTTTGPSAPPDVNIKQIKQGLLSSLSSELQKLIGTKVSIDYADAKGKLQIHFYSDDQLTQIMEKMRTAWEK